MATYEPRHEDIHGSDLTGIDGAANRTYVLANAGAILASFSIFVDQTGWQPNVNFTLDTDTDTITFISKVWDSQAISLDYFTTDNVPSGTNYCNTLQIARYAGVGTEVHLEELGTGDNSENSYDTKYGNIIDLSYRLYYGNASSPGENNLTSMGSSLYSITLGPGAILLTAAGITAVNGKKIYISYTQSPKQSDTLLQTYIAPASREVDSLTGNKWGSAASYTEYFDGYNSGYPQTDKPFGTQIDPESEFELKYQSIQSITSVQFLDNKGDVDQTVDSNYIQFEEEGRVILTTATVPNGKKNVKIIYSQGYSEVPDLVQELTALIAGKMALIFISGGSYSTVTGYTIGRVSFSVGEQYFNIEATLKVMQRRIDTIVEDLGYRFAVA